MNLKQNDPTIVFRNASKGKERRSLASGLGDFIFCPYYYCKERDVSVFHWSGEGSTGQKFLLFDQESELYVWARDEHLILEKNRAARSFCCSQDIAWLKKMHYKMKHESETISLNGKKYILNKKSNKLELVIEKPKGLSSAEEWNRFLTSEQPVVVVMSMKEAYDSGYDKVIPVELTDVKGY